MSCSSGSNTSQNPTGDDSGSCEGSGSTGENTRGDQSEDVKPTPGRTENCGVCGQYCPCVKVCIIRPEALPLTFLMPTDIRIVTDPAAAKADIIVVVGPEAPDDISDIFADIRCYDLGFDRAIQLFKSEQYPLPILYSPLVQVTQYHDVRVYHDAAVKALNRVVLGKFRNPLVYVPRCTVFENGHLATVLGALQAVYVPLQVREECPNSTKLVKTLWLLVENPCVGEVICREISVIEPGRFTFRDVAMGDPERLTPIQIEDYVYELFQKSSVLSEIICDPDAIRKDFPLFDAVNRGVSVVKRYAGRIILLEYVPPCLPRKTLMIVGKGASFDTGGVSLKTDRLAGMSRDKSGAAAAIGFMKIIDVVKPDDIHVITALPLIRNVTGEFSYVPDEIVKSRAGMRVRFNNADAEGRLIMADALTFMREQVIAKNLPDAHLFTMGTMTHHARIAVGDGYGIVIDNSVARAENNAIDMQAIGTRFGEPHEISMLRKDDFDRNKGRVRGEDLIQTYCCEEDLYLSHIRCCVHDLFQRAHQIPMAFLMSSSGLDQHDLKSCYPIKYTHIDMQGSALNYPYIPASHPIITMYKTHLD